MTEKVPIDLFGPFARYGREQKLSLRDPQSVALFVSNVEKALTQATESDTLLHGQRTERMFEALVVSLGHYKLLKAEDTGLIHPEGQYIAPDFRIILKDGSQWLIEVKNIYERDPFRQHFRATDEYLSRLKSYAAAVGCPLKLALYWARWRMWTLVDVSDLSRVDSQWTIEMPAATQVNEFAQLGDRTIGTKPALKLRFIVDQAKPRIIGPDGIVSFTIERPALFSAGTEITDPTEQNIAWIFMNLGDWDCSELIPVISGDMLDAIELEWQPRERTNPHEDFEMIGTLSSMFSRDYATHTLDEVGVVQTEAELRPGWFSPLIEASQKSKALPLWRFVLQPNRKIG
jgi:hypothetical protein